MTGAAFDPIEQTIEVQAAGLNLDCGDDRAVFRLRVGQVLRRMRRDVIVGHVRRLGGEVEGNCAHSHAARALADAWISRHG